MIVRWGIGSLPQVLEELAGLAGAKPLREYAVPHDDLRELAEATAVRPAAKGNPRPAPPEEILKLLESVW